MRDKKSPYIPEVKNSWDTQNFDPYDESEPWFPAEGSTKIAAKKKKNPEFIGYTYKPMEEPNSALVKALVDLDSYRVTQMNPINHLDYLQPEPPSNDYQVNLGSFKKGIDKAERISKETFVARALTKAVSRKNEEKEKERYKFLYGDTP